MSDTIAYNSTSASDVVGVFDTSYNQLFATARPLKASVKEKAKVMKHPVESGATVSDFRIIEEIEIDLHFVLYPTEYVDTYNQIKAVFKGESVVSVQTKTGLYQNMMISAMPHDEDTTVVDTIKITVNFTEVQLVSPASSTPLPQSAVTKSGGNVNAMPASQTQTNTATQSTQQSSAAYSYIYGNK